MHAGPETPWAPAYYILDDLHEYTKEYDVYLPRNEPGKDLGTEVYDVGAELSGYRFLQSAKWLKTDTIFFPATRSIDGRGIVAYVPPGPFWTDVGIPRLKAVYPEMEVRPIRPPEPWGPRDRPMIFMLRIPADALRNTEGLRIERDDEGRWMARGYFVAENPGLYDFRCPEGGEVEVGGRSVAEAVLLAPGAVAVSVRWSGPEDEPRRVFFSKNGAPAEEVAGRTFHAPTAAESLIAPCLNRPAEAARFAFVTERTYELNELAGAGVRDAVVTGGTVFCTKSDGTLTVLDGGVAPGKTFSLGGGGDYRLSVSGSGVVWAYRYGGNTFFKVKPDTAPVPVKLGGASGVKAVYFDDDGSLYAFSGNVVRVYREGEWEKPSRERHLPPVPPPGLPVSPWSICAGPGGDLVLLDEKRQEIIVEGEGVSRLTIPHLWWDSVVLPRPQGGWLVKTWQHGILSFSPGLGQILDPGSGWAPFLLWRTAAGDPQNVSDSCAFHSYADGSLSFIRFDNLVYMRSLPIQGRKRAVHGAEKTAADFDTWGGSYAVSPRPERSPKTGAGETVVEDDERFLQELDIGFNRTNTDMHVTLDIDLGRQAVISGAEISTYYQELELQVNKCSYGADYVQLYGSPDGRFGGEEKLLGKAGGPKGANGEGGKCFFEIRFAPYNCRYVRFVVKKQFGDGSTGTDWLFIKRVELLKAPE